MPSPFSRKSARRTAVCLALGTMAAQCLGTGGAFQSSAWAQEPAAGQEPPTTAPENPALQNATEAQVQELWRQMQGDSAELEATDPRAAITRYQKFFEQGAGRFPSVGVQIALRIARLWQLDLGNYDKAIEIYDWALGLYKNQPQEVLVQLQQGRLTAEQTQEKAERAKKNKGTVPGMPGSAPLTVGVPQPATPGKLEVGAPSLNLNTSPMAPLAVAYLAPPGNALGWQPGPDRCVTALAQGVDGAVWVATEDAGVWVYNPSVARAQDRWHQFTAKDGLGDDSAYALAVDKQNRVWAGTLNHGVSVWNGEKWKNYGVLDGPLGERVFAIKVCPTDGDVWIATNAGLSRYSVKNDSWNTITRAEGLPSDQVQAITFDQGGNIVVGTQCDGVALAKAADGYKTWRQVKGPEQMPTTATGKGLPSNLINDVLVAKDGTIYAATTMGLAWSSDSGANWSYARGQDYASKIKGSYAGPPPGWSEQPGALLAEDYVSCLEQDEAGHLWLGHWQAGSEMVQMQSGPAGLSLQTAHRQDGGLVRAMLPQNGGALLLARYDEGLSYSGSATALGGSSAVAKPAVAGGVTASVSPFPLVAKAPTLDELNALLASLGKIEPLDPQRPIVTELAEDWTTQGEWLGRYGRYWASLNAMVSPRNYYWGGGWTKIAHAFQLSPHEHNNSLRYFVSSLQTDNPCSLEMPPTYLDSRLQKGLTTPSQYRRQAELDDNGEAYPLAKEGPNIYFSIEIPSGLWTLSFYNNNKDGHDALNRLRDYQFSIRPHDETKPIGDVTDFDHQTELAHSRQHDFFGGVYKRFLVRGPQQLTIEMAKNNSLNTILAGAFLDMVDEQPAPYFGSVASWQKRQSAREQEHAELATQSAQERAARFAPSKEEKEAANRLFVEIERLREANPLLWAQRSRPIYAALARWTASALPRANAEDTPKLLIQQSSCFYNLMRYNDWEVVQRRMGLKPARDIEKSLKWDGHSSDGEGFQVISAQQSHLRLGETPQ